MRKINYFFVCINNENEAKVLTIRHISLGFQCTCKAWLEVALVYFSKGVLVVRPDCLIFIQGHDINSFDINSRNITKRDTMDLHVFQVKLALLSLHEIYNFNQCHWGFRVTGRGTEFCRGLKKIVC